MTSKNKAPYGGAENDNFNLDLIPDPEVAKSLGVTLMTLWRWSHDPSMGFPARIKLKSRNYRRASEMVAWRDLMVRKAAAALKKAAAQ